MDMLIDQPILYPADYLDCQTRSDADEALLCNNQPAINFIKN
jgi:hypothetical protein